MLILTGRRQRATIVNAKPSKEQKNSRAFAFRLMRRKLRLFRFKRSEKDMAKMIVVGQCSNTVSIVNCVDWLIIVECNESCSIDFYFRSNCVQTYLPTLESNFATFLLTFNFHLFQVALFVVMDSGVGCFWIDLFNFWLQTTIGFYHAFLASLSVIIVSELGDKTWFIAAM